MDFKSFPKIFAIGDRHIQDIFSDFVEITEKVDGSQFGFGKSETELLCRSKGQMLNLEAPEKMFNEAVDYVKSIEGFIRPGNTYYAEYLKKPKHNTLAYDRVPKNHLALFGWICKGEWVDSHEALWSEADRLGVDVVPIIFHGRATDPTEIFDMIDKVSFLGGQKIEGIVVKNYKKSFWIADRLFPIMSGKYVSEKFKEVHGNTWKKENTGKGKWEVFIEKYRSEARWEKAIIHLTEAGNLEHSPRDIGNLIKEVKSDIADEEKENIKDFLWQLFNGELLRKSTAGLPEWYKKRLVDSSFE